MASPDFGGFFRTFDIAFGANGNGCHIQDTWPDWVPILPATSLGCGWTPVQLLICQRIAPRRNEPSAPGPLADARIAMLIWPGHVSGIVFRASPDAESPQVQCVVPGHRNVPATSTNQATRSPARNRRAFCLLDACDRRNDIYRPILRPAISMPYAPSATIITSEGTDRS